MARANPAKLSSTKVAPACGLSRYASVKSAYRERAGITKPVFNDFTLAVMKLGNDEECVIRRLLRRLIGEQYAITAEWTIFYSKAPRWLSATPDGIMRERVGKRRTFNVELKRCQSLVSEPRLIHMIQVLVQCLCTRARGAVLFYVSPANGFRLYRFEWSADVQRLWDDVLKPRCVEFLAMVKRREMPGAQRGKAAFGAEVRAALLPAFTQVAEYYGPVYKPRSSGGYTLYI